MQLRETNTKRLTSFQESRSDDVESICKIDATTPLERKSVSIADYNGEGKRGIRKEIAFVSFKKGSRSELSYTKISHHSSQMQNLPTYLSSSVSYMSSSGGNVWLIRSFTFWWRGTTCQKHQRQSLPRKNRERERERELTTAVPGHQSTGSLDL